MASSRAPNSAVHRTCVKQRGSRVKPEVATVSLARGVFGGWTACEDRDRTRAIKPWGIPQDVDAVRDRTSISHMHLNSYIQLSLSLAQQFLFKTFVLQIQTNIARISFFLFSLYNAQTLEYFFFYLPILLFTSKCDKYRRLKEWYGNFEWMVRLFWASLCLQ